jgi:hypothetical protein
MTRFNGPLWRVAGSFVSWFVFTLSFTLLYLGSAVVMGLGGYCASGGPYVIETECPDAVVAFVPLSIFTGLAAVAVGVIFARGFGTPLVSWAWPILFIGLGAAFLISSTAPGGISFLIIGIVFVAMGGFPLVLEFRASAPALFLGTTNAADAKFELGAGRRSSLIASSWVRRDGDSTETLPPTAGDWALSLGILIAAASLGVYLAWLLFTSVGA